MLNDCDNEYDNEQLEGYQQIIRSPDGRIEGIAEYDNNNQLHGYYCQFNDQQKLISILNFCHGDLTGVQILFDENEKPMYITDIQNKSNSTVCTPTFIQITDPDRYPDFATQVHHELNSLLNMEADNLVDDPDQEHNWNLFSITKPISYQKEINVDEPISSIYSLGLNFDIETILLYNKLVEMTNLYESGQINGQEEEMETPEQSEQQISLPKFKIGKIIKAAPQNTEKTTNDNEEDAILPDTLNYSNMSENDAETNNVAKKIDTHLNNWHTIIRPYNNGNEKE